MARHNKISKEVEEKIMDLLRNTPLTYAAIAKSVNLKSSKVVHTMAHRILTKEELLSRKSENYRQSKTGMNNPSFGLTGENSRKYKGVIDDKKGYKMIIRPQWYTGRQKSKHVFLHHFVVCENLQITQIPKGFHIHHCDCNPHNNDFSNLVLIPMGLHVKLHSELIRASGVKSATTSSKERTLKWVEAHGFRFNIRDMIWSALHRDMQQSVSPTSAV